MRILYLSRKNIGVGLGIVLLLLFLVMAVSHLAQPAFPVSAAADKALPIYKVATDQPQVAISFDASWGADYTEQLLCTLDEYGVQATFFLVSMWIEAYPDLVAQIAACGHELGLHSTTHPHFTDLSDEEIEQDLEINYQLTVENATAFPLLFRPPFGDYDSRVVEKVRDLGYECIQWSVDSLDWKDLTAEEIYNRVTKNIEPGDIVLFHNNGLHTAEALPLILDYFDSHGLQAVPVSELLLTGEYYVDSQGVQRPVM
jgi:polysaccharide deacetylase family sporulation protein PdaB